ncbi:MAG: hypothetical protein GWP05_04135 [Anaerolineaceae bacterium]|nr:hypothetical protein [Anaerolineaceae bacterium]
MAVVLAAILSIAVVGGILAATALLTSERLSGKSEPQQDRQASLGVKPAESPSDSGPAAVKPRSDAFFKEMIKVMGYLARGKPGDGSDEDLQERIRLAQQLAPIDSSRTGNQVPDDLVLPEGSRILTVVGAQAAGPRDTIILARAPGHREAVEDHFRAEAARRGWKAVSRPAMGGRDVRALLMEKGRRIRLVTIRELASGEQCVVAIYDAAGQER